MSRDNLELVRGFYDAFAVGELPLHLLHEGAVYVNPDYAVEPGTRPFATAFGTLLETYPDFRLEPEEFIEAGEHVVVIVKALGTGVSGVLATQLLGHVWTLRDGKVARFRWFGSRGEALAAAGLEG